MSNVILYHATSPEAALAIVKEGFAPGWGDAGHGVYFYTYLADAIEYGKAGGWDKSLDNFAVVSVIVPNEETSEVEVNPAWPNPEKYENVRWIEIGEDVDDDFRFKGTSREIVANGKRRRNK